jgi:hypothetical protein
VCVFGGSPKLVLAAAEELRAREELRVDLEADHNGLASST